MKCPGIKALAPSISLACALACQPASPGQDSKTLDEELGITVAQSDKQRITAPEVAPAQVSAQVAASNAFALDLYAQLAEEDGNLFYSPTSVSFALAMTWAGAASDTEAQMAQALRFELGQAELHPVFNHLDLALNSRGQGASGMDGQPFRLRVVNAIWGQQGFHFEAPFLDTLALNYGAGMRLLDFEAETEASRQTINTWVEEQTEERIKDLLPAGSITDGTRLVLTNAIYFNAAWESPFEEERTEAQDFTLLAGGSVRCDMMQQSVEAGYAEGDGFQAVQLGYDGGELGMLVVVPDAGGFASFEAGLSGAQVEAIVAQLQPTLVELSLPKWKFEGNAVSLVEPLQALGMQDPFDGELADFSGMTGTRQLFISDVIHKAFVQVNEKGTEAAAATAVVMNDTSAPADFAVLTVDRPFLYFIRDYATGSILFVGRVLDPTQG